MGSVPRPIHHRRRTLRCFGPVSLALCLLGLGCAGSKAGVQVNTGTKGGRSEEAVAVRSIPLAASAARDALGSAYSSVTGPGQGKPSVPPERVEAGTIPRAALMKVLSNGISRFLQKVSVERFPERGRFMGWRLLGFFADRPELAAHSAVQPGDVIVRVNRHSIERPEQFATVWHGLKNGSELVIDILRGKQPTQIRYRISDDQVSKTPVLILRGKGPGRVHYRTSDNNVGKPPAATSRRGRPGRARHRVTDDDDGKTPVLILRGKGPGRIRYR